MTNDNLGNQILLRHPERVGASSAPLLVYVVFFSSAVGLLSGVLPRRAGGAVAPSSQCVAGALL